MSYAYNPLLVRDPYVSTLLGNAGQINLLRVVYGTPLLKSYLVNLTELALARVEFPTRDAYLLAKDALIKMRIYGFVYIVPTPIPGYEWYAVSGDELVASRGGEATAVVTVNRDNVMPEYYEITFSTDSSESVMGFVWNNMGGRVIGDLTPDVYYLAVKANGVLNQVYLQGAKSHFFVLQVPANTDADDLASAFAQVDYMNALYVKGDGVAVTAVTAEGVKYSIEAYDELVRQFAGATMLPISFYRGERESQGLSEAGEKIDRMRVDDRIAVILNNAEGLLRYVGGRENSRGTLLGEYERVFGDSGRISGGV